MKKFHIFLDKNIVGYAEIYQEGLYCRVIANCFDIPPNFYRLLACSEGNNTDLGLCIHRNDMYIWNKKIPLKGINVEEIRFILQSSGKDQNAIYINIDPNEKFPYFSQILNCVFKEKNGQKGICIMKHHPDMQD